MKCYYHQAEDAVGTCRSCGKGLCAACAVDLGKGLACRNRCEDDVRALVRLIDQNLQLQAVARRSVETAGSMRIGLALFLLIIGLVFIGLGLFGDRGFGFGGAMGICFLAFGGFFLYQGLRIHAARQQHPANDPSHVPTMH